MRCAGKASLLVTLCLFLGGCTTTDSLSTNYSIERNQPAPGHWIEQPRLLSEPSFEIVFDQQESRELFQTTEQTLLEPWPVFECGWVGFDSLAWKFRTGMRLSLTGATLSWVPIEGQVNTEVLYLVLHPPFDPLR